MCALLVLSGLAGCTGAAPAAQQQSTATAPVSAGPQGSTEPGHTVTVSGQVIRGVPAGFEFPPDVVVTTSSTTESGGVVQLAAPLNDTLLAFYRSRLPIGGFGIVGDTPQSIAWAGRGYTGAIQSGGIISFTRGNATQRPAKEDQTPLDFGLVNVPQGLRYPAGTSATQIADRDAGASYYLTGRPPAEVAQFFAEGLADWGERITSDTTSGGTRTIKFSDPDFDSTLTASADGLKLSHVRR